MFVKPVISLTPETQEHISPTFRKSPKNITKFTGSSPASIIDAPQLALKSTGAESPQNFFKFSGVPRKSKEKSPISSSSSPKAYKSPKQDKLLHIGNTFFARISKSGLKSAGLTPSMKEAVNRHRRSTEILIMTAKKSEETKETRKHGKKDLSKYKELIDVKNAFERSERFHAEVKKIFKNRFYKKTFYLMEKYYEVISEEKKNEIHEHLRNQKQSGTFASEHNMLNVSAEVHVSRLFLVVTLKNLKNQILGLFYSETALTQQSNLTKNKRITVLKEYSLMSLRVLYRFLIVYIRLVVQKHHHQPILNPEFNDFPSISSEDEPKFIRSNRRVLTFPKFEAGEKDNKFLDYLEFVKRFDLNEIKTLNLRFEIEELIRILIGTMLWEVVLLKNEGKIRECFIVVCSTLNLCKIFESSTNPDILGEIGKLKSFLGVLNLEFGRMEAAFELLQDALTFLQLELRIRMNHYRESKKERYRFKKTVKLIISCLTNISHVFWIQRRYGKLCELNKFLSLLTYYLKGTDDIRRFVIRNSVDIKEKFQIYFQEIDEMECIIKSFLKDDKDFIEAVNADQLPLQKEETLNDFYDKKFYTKYDWKTFNQEKLILFKRPKEIQEEDHIEDRLRKSLQNCREMSHIALKLKTMLSVPQALQRTANYKQVNMPRSPKNRRESIFTMEEKAAKESLEINSFLSNESTFVQPSANSFLSLKSLKAQNSRSKKKDLRLLSKRYFHEFSSDHKPKVLTTDIYFERTPIGNSCKAEKKKQVDFQRKNSEPDCKDLDKFFQEKIERKIISDYKNRDFKTVMEKFKEKHKQEDFDKKEFLYCRKMLSMKRNEQLKDQASDIPSRPICKIPVNNEIQHEAQFFESKTNLEMEVDALHQKLKKQHLLQKEKAKKASNEKSCFDLLSGAFIKNKGRLHLFNLADKLQTLRKKHKKATFQEKDKEKESFSNIPSDLFKNPSFSRENLEKNTNICKSQTFHNSSMSLFLKQKDEMKMAGNINKRMMEALQREMGKLESHLVMSKETKGPLINNWPKDLGNSVKKK